MISGVELVGWEVLQVKGKLVFDWHDKLWTILGAILFHFTWILSLRFYRYESLFVLVKCRVHDVPIIHKNSSRVVLLKYGFRR